MNIKNPSKRPIGIPIPNPMIPNKLLTIPISSQSKGFERKYNKSEKPNNIKRKSMEKENDEEKQRK